MNFLDKSGLQYLWTKIKASFGTAIVESSQNSNIPFVTNHQIVSCNTSGNINLHSWFKKASKGGILEIVFTGSQGGTVFCSTDTNNYLYKMEIVGSQGPQLRNIVTLGTAYNTYARLIKMDDDKLVVAEYVQNK